MSEVPIGEIPLVPSAELGVPVGYVEGGASAVPVGVMPLLTLAVLRVGEDGGTSGVPSCRVDGGASVVFVGEKALVASAIPV